MNYAYYPGCSLSESAEEYDRSTREVLSRLGVQLEEIEDWTCCGASAVESVSRLLTFTLPGRNLALAGRDLPDKDVLVPCSACYLNHLRVVRETAADKELLTRVNEVLDVEGLALAPGIRVRHLLDVLLNDVDAENVAERVQRPLSGLVVAPYYGCQVLRPYPEFDDPERPRSMIPVLKALGVEIHDWAKGGSCCGASLMATKKEVALDAVASILRAASGPNNGAHAIVTVCPMCQMNLEAHQQEAARRGGPSRPVTVLYLPQLMGLAFGLSRKDVMLHKNMVVTDDFLRALEAETVKT
jgi:heterodisulfide reductase subunit B